MNFDKEESYNQFLKCKEENENFSKDEVKISFQFSKLKTPYDFSSEISFSNNNENGKIEILNKDRNINIYIFNTSDYCFKYVHIKDSKGEERKLLINPYGIPNPPNLVEMQFSSIPYEEYDLEETE